MVDGALRKNNMPIYDITAPDGNTYEITAPEGASEADIMAYAQSEYATPQQEQPQAPTGLMGDITTMGLSVPRGLSLGLSDEIGKGVQAGIFKMRGAEDPWGEAEKLRQGRVSELERYQDANPVAGFTGEVLGGLTTGVAGAGKVAGTKLGQAIAKSPYIGGASVGALSGGVYESGVSEKEGSERAIDGLRGVGYGAAGGVAGASLGALTQRALKVYANRGKKAVADTMIGKADDFIDDIATKQDIIPEASNVPSAYGKVEKQLRKDLKATGIDYDSALKAYKEGDISLIELNTSRSKTLAQGAAQYPEGKAKAQAFFDPKTAGSYDRVISNIKDNVSSVDSYYSTADDLLSAGRVKAAPLYKNAHGQSVSGIIKTGADGKTYTDLPKEINTAIAKARRQYPSELDGLLDDSVKVLDYAKRALDDDINSAMRAGKGNLSASRTEIKNQLTTMIDKQVPSYAEARKVSGDYLSINSAMEQGKSALKSDSEVISKAFKELTEPEQQAFQVGLGKAIRDEVGKVAEGANPYRRILGSPEKQKRIQSILTPKQYKNLASGLKAEDRLFNMRNEILGGSPTAGKQEAKNLISSGVGAVDDMAQIPRKTMIGGLKMVFDGLDDKTAGKVSEILYETDPQKKLVIISNLSKAKDFTALEKSMVKKAYFQSADQFDTGRLSGSVSGGVGAGTLTKQESE